jgi:multidrug efflux pump subunit AcrB
VLLGNVAEIRQGVGPVMIERKYQQRIVKVSANPAGRDLGSLSQELEERLQGLALPPGFTVQLGGQTQQQREAFGSLRFTALLALILVYMVMASQFRSLLDPFIIMFSVPLGLIGVVWALFLTHTTLSVTSFMGIIMMVGIVVAFSLLMVDFANRLRSEGVELEHAILTAAKIRLRPILMTSLAATLGLVPMAIAGGANIPLARAVIGGVLASTVLTLVVVPILYTLLKREQAVTNVDDEGGI